MIKNFIVIGMIYIVSSGCSMSRTDKTGEYGDSLEKAIESFEKSRIKTGKGISETIEPSLKVLARKKPNLRFIGNHWEKKWAEVRKEVRLLQINFAEVGNTSRAYFDKLNEIAHSITDENLKNAELEKNRVLKSSWADAYQEANMEIERIEELMIEGDDFHKVVLGNMLRVLLKDNIEDLKRISESARNILDDLERLTIEGRKLVGVNHAE